MHAPITFAEGYQELNAHPYGILKGVVDGNAFVKGSWGAAIVDALAPEPGDIVIEGKRGLDTFATTNLDFVLRSNDIETVVLVGHNPGIEDLASLLTGESAPMPTSALASALPPWRERRAASRTPGIGRRLSPMAKL